MSFNVNYNAGGVIDEIKKVNLPERFFPNGDTPKMKGFRIDVPAIAGEYSLEYVAPEGDIDLIDVSIACSGYHDGDYWDFEVGNTKICETLYTRELPENIAQSNAVRLFYKIKRDTVMKMIFNNISGTSKKVWFTIKYLYKEEGV